MLWFVQDRLDLIIEKRHLQVQTEQLEAKLSEKTKDKRSELLERCARAGLKERNIKNGKHQNKFGCGYAKTTRTWS